MIKAIITDLDDTLLRYDKTVSPYTVNMLRLCRKKNIKLAIATARSESAERFVSFELFDGFILMNGATAMADNQRVYERLMEPAIFVPILKEFSRLHIHAAVEMNGIHYSNFDVPNRKYEITNFDKLTEKSEKFYAIVDSPEKAKIIKGLIPAGLRVYFTEDNYALITHSEATKANAISALLNYWHLSFDDTVAFGDASNDIDMLIKCGIGVAMENARDDIKAAANEVCGSCENDGVAKWLEERIL